MAISKLILNGQVQIDVTSDTVTTDKLMQGYTAHDKTGAVITGTASGAESYTVSLGTMPNDRDKAYVADSTNYATSTKYISSNTSFSLPAGTQFEVCVIGTSSATNYIYYNNKIVNSNTYSTSYIITMPKYDIEINVSGDNTSGRSMYISTPMLTINENGYHNVESYGFIDVQAAPTYTATFITTSGDRGSNYVSYTNASGLATNYYSAGSTFTFSAGDTATFVGTYAGACNRYLNGELISTDTNYVYTLPACNIEIQLQNYNSPSSQYAIQRITTLDGIDALTITQNGTYTASGDTKGYSPITVNVSGSGGGDFTVDQIAMRTISGDISGSATSISMYAFYACKNLTTASFPSCTSIGASAFAYCSSLTTVSFPSCKSIRTSAFHSCIRLTTASFPSCTSIEGYAFANCSSLTTANFPLCSSIAGFAFSNCSSLTTVSFPLCSYIGSYAFRSCTRLTTASFPSCTSISMCAFSYCSSLTTANFPLCTSIGGSAFYSCSRLTTVSFPLCTSISTNVFAYCYSLTTVSFPSCTSIGTSVFVYCYNLLSIYLLGSSVPFLSSNAFYSTPIGGYTTSTGGVYGSIFVPASLYDSYLTATNWSLYSDRIVSV